MSTLQHFQGNGLAQTGGSGFGNLPAPTRKALTEPSAEHHHQHSTRTGPGLPGP